MRLPLTILSILIAVVVLSGCRREQWHDLRPTGEPFMISMPAQPKVSEAVRELPLGRLKIVGYATTTSNQITFTLHYTDFPSAMTEGRTADAMLDSGLEQTFARYPRASTQRERTVIQGFPGRTFTIVDPDSGYTTFGRTCLVENRTYVIQAVMPTPLSGSSEIRRFLDSFQLSTNAPKKRP
jgi:hypothetical protein